MLLIDILIVSFSSSSSNFHRRLFEMRNRSVSSISLLTTSCEFCRFSFLVSFVFISTDSIKNVTCYNKKANKSRNSNNRLRIILQFNFFSPCSTFLLDIKIKHKRTFLSSIQCDKLSIMFNVCHRIILISIFHVFLFDLTESSFFIDFQTKRKFLRSFSFSDRKQFRSFPISSTS